MNTCTHVHMYTYACMYVQWNLSVVDPTGPRKCVLIREVSLFQGCSLREVPLNTYIHTQHIIMSGNSSFPITEHAALWHIAMLKVATRTTYSILCSKTNPVKLFLVTCTNVCMYVIYPHLVMRVHARLQGYNNRNGYIATQGPIPSTFADLWRLIWDFDIPTIVMVTNLQEDDKVCGPTCILGYFTWLHVATTLCASGVLPRHLFLSSDF